MLMQPEIKDFPGKKFLGKKIQMTLADNKTGELWRSFVPAIGKIKNNTGAERYSIEIYDPEYFKNFSPEATFEKWAAVAVSDFETIPDGMQTLTLSNGVYAVFLYKGPASAAQKVFQYIFGTWLPNSDYLLDDRPHFEVMGAKYKNDDPDSEEELWIPVKPK